MLRCGFLSLPRIPSRQCLPPSQQFSSHTLTSEFEVRGTQPRVIAQSTYYTPSVSQFVAPPTVIDKSQATSSATVPAIRILRRVFSLSNLTSGTPVTYSIRTLRGLYHGAHARGTLNDLSDSQFSAIIFLFGTLSVHDPPSQFISPLAQYMDMRRSRAWWGFIFQVVRDKQRVTGHLNEGDLYWLLRARTSEASITGLDVYAGDRGEFTVHRNASELY